MQKDYRVFTRQTWALTKANLKSRYRKTFIGFLWVILNPLIFFGVQSYVFNQVLKIPVNEYLLFLMSGIIPWVFLSQSLEMGTGALVSSSAMIKSFSAHPLVYLGASALDNFVNFCCVLLICIAIATVKGKIELWSVVLLPLPVLTLLIGVFSLTWILAAMHVFFRDVRFIVTFVLSLLFFITPIFYPRALVPENYRWLVDANLIYKLIEPFQRLLHDRDLTLFLNAELVAAATAVGLFLLAYLLWRTLARSLYAHI